VLLLGRSLHRHFEVARDTGYLPDPGTLLVGENEARDLPPSSLMVLATGTQGEPPAAIARLADERHPAVSLSPGDRVIFSSRIIPGNETRVYDVINSLIRLGADVRFGATDRGVHVSGHAHAGEQRRMLGLVRPEAFIPVHGTRMHLERHAALARAEGVRETLVVENGAVVEVDDNGLAVVDHATVGRVAVDRHREIPREVLEERALLGELGCAFVVVPLDAAGRLHGRVSVVTRGVVGDDEGDALEMAAERFVQAELEGTKRSRKHDPEALTELARRALRRFFRRELGRKPVTVALSTSAERGA
jgi:ribonuclease J